MLLLPGCGGGDEPGTASTADVPPPPIAQLLPPGYRAQEVLKANLTEGAVPETVVTSVGPPTTQFSGVPLRPATLQVLSWDAEGDRWQVIFDAQKAIKPKTSGNPRTSNGGPGAAQSGVGEDPQPILDPEAEVTLDVVDFARLLKGERDQLVFSATLSYGGSGLPQILVVADFEDAKAKVLYAWSGEHLEVELVGDRIHARSSFWTRADSHCCPSRGYRFVVGSSGGSITVLEDERPYLGVLVREQGEFFGEGPLKVLEVAKGSPAAGKLLAGDVLLDVENASPPEDEPFYRKLSAFDEGETARLVIRRDGARMAVPVKLGSLKDARPLSIPEDGDRVEAL
jgi:hypothetical protein